MTDSRLRAITAATPRTIGNEPYSAPKDVDQLQNLHDAGYLEVSFQPLERYRRTPATVAKIASLGRTAVKYFGCECEA